MTAGPVEGASKGRGVERKQHPENEASAKKVSFGGGPGWRQLGTTAGEAVAVGGCGDGGGGTGSPLPIVLGRRGGPGGMQNGLLGGGKGGAAFSQ